MEIHAPRPACCGAVGGREVRGVVSGQRAPSASSTFMRHSPPARSDGRDGGTEGRAESTEGGTGIGLTSTRPSLPARCGGGHAKCEGAGGEVS